MKRGTKEIPLRDIGESGFECGINLEEVARSIVRDVFSCRMGEEDLVEVLKDILSHEWMESGYIAYGREWFVAPPPRIEIDDFRHPDYVEEK